MTDTLDDLPFINLYIRLDAPEPPTYRSQERGQAALNRLVPDDKIAVVERFGTAIRAELQDRPDGTITFDGIRCRLSQQMMADGSKWACAHRINTNLPDLANLGFASHIYNHLHTLGMREGLILVSSAAGHGKTTTAVGLLIDYLKSYGGTAVTIEKPVEYITRGRHGEFGQCFQMEIQTDDEWADALERSANWSPRYIYVGDVRTPKAAEQLLHAATTGHTVITTLHSGMPEEALVSLLFLAEQAMGSGAANILAGCLTALIHQTMKEEGPFVRYLFTEENAPSDPIRSLIREGKIGMLATYIDRIAARLANQPLGGNPMGTMPHPMMPFPPIKR